MIRSLTEHQEIVNMPAIVIGESKGRVYDRIGGRTLNDAVAERAVERPDAPFLVFEAADGTVQQLTYREFDARCDAVAGGLAQLGVTQGDKVVLRMTTRAELLISWFALLRIGAVAVPAILSLTPDETAWMAEFVDAVGVITEPAWQESYEHLRTSLPELRHVVVVADEPGLAQDGVVTLAELERPSRGYVAPTLAPDDLAQIIFTSGSTSRPKAVMITHANLLHSGERQSSMRALDDGERCLTALPWFHVNCQCVTVLAALAVGGTAILLERYSASRFMEQVRRHRATQVTLGSMLVRTLLAQPPSPDDARHDVRRAFYGLAITDEERETFERRFSMTLLNGYGLSEAVAEVTAVPVHGPKRWPSIGLPVQDRLVRLVDDVGQDVAPGETGEIMVYGRPGWTLMKGYYRDPEATARTIRDGWLLTGDLARADEVGYLYFVGRKKDVIKRAGENVSALEVEETLMSHPAVVEVAVVAAPDLMRDEAVWAFVAVTDDAIDEQQLIDHCAQHLAPFKVPSVVRLRGALPVSAVGKIDKERLRREARNLVDADSPTTR
ncbi:MAG TPA: AMP-binding protein [Baekduia sp.]|nr:AMP-binding protein [Baekduia sp.]